MYLAGSVILIVSVLTVIGTLISDILLAWLDPRVRLRYRRWEQTMTQMMSTGQEPDTAAPSAAEPAGPGEPALAVAPPVEARVVGVPAGTSSR